MGEVAQRVGEQHGDQGQGRALRLGAPVRESGIRREGRGKEGVIGEDEGS